MRLLHTKTLQFDEFFDSDIPSYAILSHRWDKREISFQEFEASKDKVGSGFTKLINSCSVARKQGFKWIWVDTCCIDKKSSAELSEAINSMYRWYANAAVCYAYLVDVRWDSSEGENRRNFESSVWFTRGWTLQELLASPQIHFYDADWKMIGTKEDFSTAIAATTRISQYHLERPKAACVATKFSWISKRKTSRVEDLAYCMLGLFEVNMPLLYGEGEKAFMRLQLEIIRKTDDESIFAWRDHSNSITFGGMLATWPTFFADSGHMTTRRYMRSEIVKAYAITNRGLEIQVPRSLIVPLEETSDRMTLSLACFDGEQPVAITLESDQDSQKWYRTDCRQWHFDSPKYANPLDTISIYIYQNGL